MEMLAQELAVRTAHDILLPRRAARLSKADLSTGLVGEFPELQGVMGRYCALYGFGQTEDPAVADAIGEHYKPVGPNDICPMSAAGIIVALSDKFDTVVGFFAHDERPTGSGDPYALRRAALGIVRIILEKNLRLQLDQIFDAANTCLIEQKRSFYRSAEARVVLINDLRSFILDRLRIHLRERGVRHDLIAATAIWGTTAEDDIRRLVWRVQTLSEFLASDDGRSLLIAYRRASNIVDIEERRDGVVYSDNIVPALLKQNEELNLAASLERIGNAAGRLLLAEQFELAMTELASLRQPVDEFFDKVTVNVDDRQLRENRLRLLAGIRATMKQVADFSQIEG
jgi:glycyl-tRNA synthetase beta chain